MSTVDPDPGSRGHARDVRILFVQDAPRHTDPPSSLSSLGSTIPSVDDGSIHHGSIALDLAAGAIDGLEGGF